MRAIESALSDFQCDEVEVLVIPNGSRDRWHQAIDSLPNYQNVHVYPIETANVCSARNYGLSKATGKFVRFLDDDDFLIPKIAVKQCKELWTSNADVSSYAVRIEDENNCTCATIAQPVTSDFVLSQLGPYRNQMTMSHIYRHSIIKNLKWNEKYNVSEDIVWLLSLAESQEVSWLKGDEIVGVWYQHTGPRLSYTKAANEPHKITAESILNAIEMLSRQGRINTGRKNAAAAGLWACIHKAFYFDPLYWHRVAMRALILDPDSHPDLNIYHSHLCNRLNPLLIEWLMLPKRTFNNLVRQLCGYLFGWDYVRRL